MAVWGTPDPADKAFPKPLFDAETGKLDHEEAKAYETYDIRLLLERHPEKYLPLFHNNIRIICGELDNYYLNEAVALLKQEVEKHPAPEGAAGYIKMIPNADHGGSLFMSPAMRAVPGEMIRFLEAASAE
jgi:hypothetical protein